MRVQQQHAAAAPLINLDAPRHLAPVILRALSGRAHTIMPYRYLGANTLEIKPKKFEPDERRNYELLGRLSLVDSYATSQRYFFALNCQPYGNHARAANRAV